jgi:hypothetical protein
MFAFILRFQEQVIDRADGKTVCGTQTFTEVRQEQPDSDRRNDANVAIPRPSRDSDDLGTRVVTKISVDQSNSDPGHFSPRLLPS